MIIKVKKLSEDAVIPKYAHPGDAAMDICSVEELTLEPGKHACIATGLSMEFEQGYFVNIRDRSGLAAKHAIHTMAGVIDSGYRGEYKIVLINLGQEQFKIEKGMRIAQMIVQKHEVPEVVEVDELGESQRGLGGFGSTGNK